MFITYALPDDFIVELACVSKEKSNDLILKDINKLHLSYKSEEVLPIYFYTTEAIY
jgi:hypothetical protein